MLVLLQPFGGLVFRLSSSVYYSMWTLSSMWVYVCVGPWEREGERERGGKNEREKEIQGLCCVGVCACVCKCTFILIKIIDLFACFNSHFFKGLI